jgi:hypothetical protein
MPETKKHQSLGLVTTFVLYFFSIAKLIFCMLHVHSLFYLINHCLYFCGAFAGAMRRTMVPNIIVNSDNSKPNVNSYIGRSIKKEENGDFGSNASMDSEGKRPNAGSYNGRPIKIEENGDSGSNVLMDSEAKKPNADSCIGQSIKNEENGDSGSNASMDTEGKKPNDNSYIGRSIKFEENDDSGSNASMDTEAKNNSHVPRATSQVMQL